MKTLNNEYQVIRKSAFGIRGSISFTGTKKQCENYCDKRNWEEYDYNEFLWNLDVERI